MKPAREHATNNSQTYFVTAKTWESRALFRSESWARLFFENLLSHRDSYLLHEFVLMPDHFHLLISPTVALEHAVQLIKGGLSYMAKKEFGSNAEIWQRGFADHRIRDRVDYEAHVHYIHLNAVKNHLCYTPFAYRYSSAFPGWKLDPIPQGLKSIMFEVGTAGTDEAVPFQNHAEVESLALKRHDLSRAEKETERRALAPLGRASMNVNFGSFTRQLAQVTLAGVCIFPSFACPAQGIVDCVMQRRVCTPFVRGIVVDPAGAPVPDTLVILEANGETLQQTRTNTAGNFNLKTPPGMYQFKVMQPHFAGIAIDLVVGRDFSNAFGRSGLYAVLGLPDSFCSMVWTNANEFHRMVDANQKTLKESSRNNATQK